jgi:hypothetical protein
LCELPTRLDSVPAGVRERVADNLLDLIATALLSNCGQAALPAGVTLVRSAYGSRGISARLCPPSVSPPSAGFRRDI